MKFLDKISFPVSIQNKNGESLFIRRSREEDIEVVTSLIQEAFNIWRSIGLSLSPMNQSFLDTKNHLLNKGFVIENKSQEIIGTFSLKDGHLLAKDNEMIFYEGESSISFTPFEGFDSLINKKFLIFKKAAVKINTANSGIGRESYYFSENLAREQKYHGMLLETVREADWLYNWYLRLGFQEIGVYTYTNSKIKTVLLAKIF